MGSDILVNQVKLKAQHIIFDLLQILFKLQVFGKKHKILVFKTFYVRAIGMTSVCFFVYLLLLAG